MTQACNPVSDREVFLLPLPLPLPIPILFPLFLHLEDNRVGRGTCVLTS